VISDATSSTFLFIIIFLVVVNTATTSSRFNGGRSDGATVIKNRQANLFIPFGEITAAYCRWRWYRTRDSGGLERQMSRGVVVRSIYERRSERPHCRWRPGSDG